MNRFLLAALAAGSLSIAGNVLAFEASCATGTPNATIGYSQNTAFTGVNGVPSYNNAACPGCFVGEITGTSGHNFQVWAEYKGAIPTNKNYCTMSGVQAQVWGWTGSTWVSMGDAAKNGVWQNERCVFSKVLVGWHEQSPYSKIRVALKGYTNTGTKIVNGRPTMTSVQAPVYFETVDRSYPG